MSAMLSLEEAQERVLALAPAMPVEELPIQQAKGRYLAHDLLAQRTQPPENLSAMDGYAVSGEGPWRLVGESRAGGPFTGSLGIGETVRISTGAHMPVGADRVLIQEDAFVDGENVACVQDMPWPGQHVRRKGFDFAEGETVLSAGARLGATQMALAITAGHSTLSVRRPPRVAVLDSGDELAADPTRCGPDQIPASNGVMLAAMLGAAGCEVTRIGPVPDDRDALAKALEQTEGHDLLVTSGGASVGDHDLMRPALEEWGGAINFWKVAMKPGKPIMVAQRGGQIVFGLPGNPVSSFVTCFLFVMPLIRAAMGSCSPLPPRVMLPAGRSLPPVGSRREFVRAVWNGNQVFPVDSQDSSALAALAASNCLIERPPFSGPAALEEPVHCYLLENGGIA